MEVGEKIMIQLLQYKCSCDKKKKTLSAGDVIMYVVVGVCILAYIITKIIGSGEPGVKAPLGKRGWILIGVIALMYIIAGIIGSLRYGG
jgi:hypothetical protein